MDDLDLEQLSPFLRERTRLVATARSKPLGEAPVRFVLYWMRTAVRGHENPALDVALSFAREAGVPAFVYHAVSEGYPYASDRHHRFILEGARDVAMELEERGVGYALHVEREGHRGPHLRTLAQASGLVVTEDMPVPPLRGWAASLSRVAPVVLVDTACVVPMRVTKRPKRAFQFRKATAGLREQRLEQPYDDQPAGEHFVPDLPFVPIDPRTADLSSLIGACEIDHGVAPVPHTTGGSRAGYARWGAFLEDGLDRYARDRNDPLKPGVSRMSAYLHYGHVSPFRIARQASASPAKGADKYLDELLIWRELSYSWAYHTREPDVLGAIPDWARSTLLEHQDDPRQRMSWETLARGKTADALWDACQGSLLRHGELHNNVRMTWGKAILGWTAGPGEAMARLLDLNHRYALDGRDPCSYGGLLWSLGLFDRPFEPERPIFGTVRPRPTKEHARRLNVERYREQVRRPAFPDVGRVAVVGAGIAGLAAARALQDHGVDVTVFDKARRVGGRMSTRRQDGFQLDHGAQYFTARDPRFKRFVTSWLEDGHVARWGGQLVDLRGGGDPVPLREDDRYVGTRGMRGAAEHMASDLDVVLETRVAPLDGQSPGALVGTDGESLGRFDRVLVTVPLEQARALFEASSFEALRRRCEEGAHAPCWAALLGFREGVDVPWDGAKVPGPLSWVARDSAKPGRSGPEAWVLHASPEWSAEHLELAPEEALRTLLRAFGELVPSLPEPVFTAAHRWRFAQVSKAAAPIQHDVGGVTIGVAGDGFAGPRVEAAFLSGVAAAGRLLGSCVGPELTSAAET